MAAKEADATAEGATRPARSSSPAPAFKAPNPPGTAVARAAEAKEKAKQARTAGADPSSSGICGFWCMLLSVVFLCVLFFGLLGLAYVNIFPGTLIRPYFFGSPHELTKANWDDKTAGKTVFLKFYAPWCGHCKRLAPTWDKLTAANANHSFLMFGEVDCTGAGKSICQEHGVQGYPSIKYGDPNNLKGYVGLQTFEGMNKFASELEPVCGPEQLQVCDEETKKQIEVYQAMSVDQRQEKILEQEAEAEKIQSAFKAFTEGLNTDYKETTAKKDEAVKAVKDPLAMLKAIAAHEATAASEKSGAEGAAKEKEGTAEL